MSHVLPYGAERSESDRGCQRQDAHLRDKVSSAHVFFEAGNE